MPSMPPAASRFSSPPTVRTLLKSSPNANPNLSHKNEEEHEMKKAHVIPESMREIEIFGIPALFTSKEILPENVYPGMSAMNCKPARASAPIVLRTAPAENSWVLSSRPFLSPWRASGRSDRGNCPWTLEPDTIPPPNFKKNICPRTMTPPRRRNGLAKRADGDFLPDIIKRRGVYA